MKRDRMTITFGMGQRKAFQAIAENNLTTITTVIRWAFAEYLAAQNPVASSNRKNRQRPAKGR